MSTYEENGLERSGRHPLSTGYLVSGLVFLGIAVTWALRAADVIGDDGSRWVLSVVLILAGVVGLVASVVRSTRSRDDDALDPYEPYGVPGSYGAVETDPDDHGSDPLAR